MTEWVRERDLESKLIYDCRALGPRERSNLVLNRDQEWFETKLYRERVLRPRREATEAAAANAQASMERERQAEDKRAEHVRIQRALIEAAAARAREFAAQRGQTANDVKVAAPIPTTAAPKPERSIEERRQQYYKEMSIFPKPARAKSVKSIDAGSSPTAESGASPTTPSPPKSVRTKQSPPRSVPLNLAELEIGKVLESRSRKERWEKSGLTSQLAHLAPTMEQLAKKEEIEARLHELDHPRRHLFDF